MRLIDADNLLKEVRENKELFESERVYLEGLLLNAPTVKAIPLSDDFLSYFRLDDNGKTLVLTDKYGCTRALKLLPYIDGKTNSLLPLCPDIKDGWRYEEDG